MSDLEAATKRLKREATLAQQELAKIKAQGPSTAAEESRPEPQGDASLANMLRQAEARVATLTSQHQAERESWEAQLAEVEELSLYPYKDMLRTFQDRVELKLLSLIHI